MYQPFLSIAISTMKTPSANANLNFHHSTRHPIVHLKFGWSGSLEAGSPQIQPVCLWLHGPLPCQHACRPAHMYLPSPLPIHLGAVEIHTEHRPPPQLHHTAGHCSCLKFGYLAAWLTPSQIRIIFGVPLAPSMAVDPFTHICPPFLSS